MGLKLLEQEIETKEWRSKYDGVTKSKGFTSHAPHAEGLGYIVLSPPAATPATASFSHALLTMHHDDVNFGHGHVSFSKLILDKENIRSILDHLKLSGQTTSICLSGCSLHDELTQELIVLLSRKELRGIDLSFNLLSTSFIEQWASCCRGRSSQSAPQYLMVSCCCIYKKG